MVGVAALVAAACTAPAAVATRAPSPQTTTSPELTIAPSPLALPTATPRPPVTEPFRCTERVPIPDVDHVVYATWSPDATKLAISRIVTLASPRTITGWEEEFFLDSFDVRTGELHPLGVGERPQWSADGRYLSYWGWDGTLRIAVGGFVVADIPATMPEARWVGETLYFMSKDEIRAWNAESFVRTIAHLPSETAAEYPSDDVYWSADGERFTLTRYSLDGTLERFLGTTTTGDLTPLDLPQATFTEWAPSGESLFVQYPDRVELHAMDGSAIDCGIDGDAQGDSQCDS